MRIYIVYVLEKTGAASIQALLKPTWTGWHPGYAENKEEDKMTDLDFLKFAKIYISGIACAGCPREGQREQRECPYEECAERIKDIWEDYN